MPNTFATTPELERGFPRLVAVWTDPVTGLRVPKDPQANLLWRANLLQNADADSGLQVDLYTACSQSLLFWVNAFAFTLRLFEPGDNGELRQAKHKHIPFLTWEIQDKHLLRIEQCIEDGESLLTDKSRDMGATWNHLAVYAHRFLFRDSESHLMISRKEDAVDQIAGGFGQYPFGSLADPGTLFGKIDYLLSRCPAWMLPRVDRKRMHLVNLDTQTRIDGESSNASAGSSDRRTSIFLDEMAKMKEGEAIKRSTADVTACRLVCSTPNGAGTAYSKWRLSGQIPVFVLPWWEHPEKGANRSVVQDDLGRWSITSPWYEFEKARRSPKELAIEVDMDHLGSGDVFFEHMNIERHRKLYAKPPKFIGTIAFRDKLNELQMTEAVLKNDHKAVKWTPGRGDWKFWVGLVDGRPDQKYTYTVACDISKGQGASNSTVSVMCNETRVKVASYASATTPPHEFARIAVAACLFFGGTHKNPYAMLIWENNGDPGFDFGNIVVRKLRYPNIYFDRVPGTLSEKRGKRYGWRSNREQKAIALGGLRRAYAHGGFVNHDALALDEALTYVYFEDGGIGPAELVEETAEARKTHGDRVIADMLCLVANDAPTTRPQQTAGPSSLRTFGGRQRRYKARTKSARSGDSWSTRGR